MYNFLDSKLFPKVSSTSLATDNYEVTNLISDNFLTKSRGYLAYTTVKPPVELSFELICPVNVHYLVLWTTLGSQKCTSIEILMKHDNREFTSIGFARFNNNGVIFCNCRIYSVNEPPPNIDKSFYLSFFKHHTFRSFTSASIIKVCILQTHRSVPCLAKIEIWGKPSKVCSLETMRTIKNLIRPSISNEKDDSPALKSLDTEEWEIPEEFKDSLTYEVMAIPITLPSGKSIDQSTLEKCIAAEASYGRAGSDPFTGQKFTDTRKPVFNAALKSRIDMFLMKNSSKRETFAIKRTVGTAIVLKKDSQKKVQSSENIVQPKKIKLQNTGDDKLIEAMEKTMNSSNFICFTNDDDSSIVTNNIKCCTQCDKTSDLFILHCDHLYCRTCLIDLCKHLICIKCKKPFCKKDAKKFHC